MDWTTIVSNASISAVSLAAVGYALKHSFERWLDARLKTTEECNRAIVAELARREATIFDEQVKACRSACTAVYAARNFAFKTLQQMSESEANSDPSDELDQSYLTIRRLLEEHIALLPSELFKPLHSNSHNVAKFAALAKGRRKTEVSPADRISELKSAYLDVDSGFTRFVTCVQEHIGLTNA